MMTRDEAQKLAEKVMGLSTFPECQVSITASEQAYTRFANNGITTASFNIRHTVGIQVTRDARRRHRRGRARAARPPQSAR